MDFVKVKLTGKTEKLTEVLDTNFMSDLIEDHFVGIRNRRLLIWSLLTLITYLRQNYGDDQVTSLK